MVFLDLVLWDAYEPTDLDMNFLDNCTALHNAVNLRGTVGWSQEDLDELRAMALRRPIARPWLTTRSARIECDSLRAAYILNMFEYDVRASQSGPSRVRPPCSWCGLTCASYCDHCEETDRPTDRQSVVGLCWRCTELFSGDCRFCWRERVDN